jgi:hypothetical protein
MGAGDGSMMSERTDALFTRVKKSDTRAVPACRRGGLTGVGYPKVVGVDE